MNAQEFAHTPGTPYVLFSTRTGEPLALIGAGDYSTIMLNKNENQIPIPMLDTTNWWEWRLVDINTLEIKRVE